MSLKIASLIKECRFQTARSGGKGGQNVNKVSTKMELYFDIAASAVFTEDEKQRLLVKLKTKLTDNGILQLVSQSERTQIGNRKRVIEKFEKLITKSLIEPKKRIPVKVSKQEKEKRIFDKKKLSEKKQARKIIDLE
jgi:ribosome-associated protein